MAADKTQHQSQDALDKARDLSLEPTRPPANIPGYVLDNFLGRGTYGEVWRATDQKTGRRVAVKFYTQRSAADVQQLAQEVEKLVVLSADRYVVQLLDVGWTAQPPYYVMDFIEQGSLEDQLQKHGVYSSDDAVELFQEIAQGMMHLHGKGIFHCDLKPANVLLDEDAKPRVADFGQSRLSSDRSGALGTLYYMAPEQADLAAAPDSRWDVYALGAILYRMLTGAPPYADEKLTEKIESSDGIGDRLAAYRSALEQAPPPTDHRTVAGVDRSLADIISRCIAFDPKDRFQSIQSVLLALRRRANRQERRPLLMLGILGPLLLMGMMSLFGGWAFNQATTDTTYAVIAEAKESNEFKSRLAARSAAEQILEYFRVVEQLAKDESFLKAFDRFDENPDLFEARQTIANPINNTRWEQGQRIEGNPRVAKARQMLLDHPDRGELVPFLHKRLHDTDQDYPEATSWFINDREGNQICSVFPSENHTQLNNYAFRTYFTGEDRDLVYGSENDSTDGVLPDSISDRQLIRQPHLSAIFLSQATNTWKVAFSAPIVRRGQSRGIVAVTVELGEFIEFSNLPDQYVMLVDNRDGEKTGTILEHPLVAELRKASASPIPRRLLEKTVISPKRTVIDFFDPMGEEEEGAGYRNQSIAAVSPVTIKRKPISTQESTTVDDEAVDQDGAVSIDTGLVVLAVEGYDRVIAPVNLLKDRLWKLLLAALLILACVAFAMWWLVNRTLQNSSQNIAKLFGPENNQSWLADRETERQT